jgi:hypothetical protein
MPKSSKSFWLFLCAVFENPEPRKLRLEKTTEVSAIDTTADREGRDEEKSNP